MPSPFPGMDPYLEDPAGWPDFHHHVISAASNQLVGQLRPKYLVRIEERVYVAEDEDFDRSDRTIAPDLRIEARSNWEGQPTSPGLATTAITEPVVATTIIELDVREARLQILDRQDRSVVTVIEILSPANKILGSRGGDSFAQKRREVLHSPSHWVEVDLLRKGHSFTPRRHLGPHSNLVHVSRAERRPEGFLWPIRLGSVLPVVDIPLKPGDPDARLDLQELLATVYDQGAYDLAIDYRKPPIPPLEGEWAEWADRLLREKGLR